MLAPTWRRLSCARIYCYFEFFVWRIILPLIFYQLHGGANSGLITLTCVQRGSYKVCLARLWCIFVISAAARFLRSQFPTPYQFYDAAARRCQCTTTTDQGERSSCSVVSFGACGCSTLLLLAQCRCVFCVCTRFRCALHTVITQQSPTLGFSTLEPSRASRFSLPGVLRAGLTARS
jgi:hypothetical protein